MRSAIDVSDGAHLKVIELYPAVQGEGTLVGVPSTFVRLAGCTVGCEWCDTKYSWKAAQGTEYTPTELVNEIIGKTTHRHVVVTGGEPLEHPMPLLMEVIRSLQQRHYHVTVETSGMGVPSDTPLNFRPRGILWSVSPKLPSSKTQKPFPNLKEWVEYATEMEHGIQLKFVISDSADLLFVQEQLNSQLRKALPKAMVDIIFQVCTPVEKGQSDEVLKAEILDQLKELQEAITEHFPFSELLDVAAPYRIRVLPQLHALIYGRRRGI